MYDNKKLKKLFLYLNDRFFGNQIAKSTKVVFSNLKNEDGIYKIGKNEILISDDLKSHSALAHLVLLHEMQHAFDDANGYIGYEELTGHGQIFMSGLDRLYKMGAYEGLL